jgi:hypothetical protein
MNCSNPGHILEWYRTCRHRRGDGGGVLAGSKGRYLLS